MMEVDLISVGSADSEERVFLVENRRDPIDGSFDTVERDLLMDSKNALKNLQLYV